MTRRAIPRTARKRGNLRARLRFREFRRVPYDLGLGGVAKRHCLAAGETGAKEDVMKTCRMLFVLVYVALFALAIWEAAVPVTEEASQAEMIAFVASE